MALDADAGKYDDLTQRSLNRFANPGRGFVSSAEFQYGRHSPSPRMYFRGERNFSGA
jgi:hypothetical protein